MIKETLNARLLRGRSIAKIHLSCHLTMTKKRKFSKPGQILLGKFLNFWSHYHFLSIVMKFKVWVQCMLSAGFDMTRQRLKTMTMTRLVMRQDKATTINFQKINYNDKTATINLFALDDNSCQMTIVVMWQKLSKWQQMTTIVTRQ